jgi:hypothetical protein
MLQGLLGSYTLLGIVHEDLSEEIEELAVEVGMTRNGFLRLLVMQMEYGSWTYRKLLHCLDIFL